jgi:hypothetical protein
MVQPNLHVARDMSDADITLSGSIYNSKTHDELYLRDRRQNYAGSHSTVLSKSVKNGPWVKFEAVRKSITTAIYSISVGKKKLLNFSILHSHEKLCLNDP